METLRDITKAMTSTPSTHPLLGKHELDGFSKILGTRYYRFVSPLGIDGLARWTDTQLELLAVHAACPGCGQFKAFIEEAKRHFATICVWHIGNAALDAALKRYGFTPESVVDEFGEHLTGLRWDKKP